MQYPREIWNTAFCILSSFFVRTQSRVITAHSLISGEGSILKQHLLCLGGQVCTSSQTV